MASAELDWYTIRGETVKSYVEELMWEGINPEDQPLYDKILGMNSEDVGRAWMANVGPRYWDASDSVCASTIMFLSKPDWEQTLEEYML